MKAGVSTACLYPTKLEKAFRMLAERGVELTEIFVNSDCELRAPYLDEMLAVQREYGIKVCSVHPYLCGIEPMMLFTQYERRVNDMLEYMRRFFEYMTRFGAKYYILHGNKPQNCCTDEVYFERYLKMQELATQYGVSVVQENVSRCTSSSLDFLKKMSDALGDKAFFVLDTKQAYRSGIEPIEIVRALGSKIVHLHYSECGQKGDCLKFGDGDSDMKPLFDELKKCSYGGNAVIELYKGSYSDADDLARNCGEMNGFLTENGFSDMTSHF